MKHLKTFTQALAMLLAATMLATCGEKDVIFTVTPQTVTIQDGSTPTVSIQTNADWYVSMVTESWLTATPMSGSGDATITIAANSENTTKSNRSAQIVITERKTQQTCVVTVTQLPPTPVLQATPAAVELSSTGTGTAVAVMANMMWMASSDQTWCTVTPATGSGNAMLTITAQPNTSNENLTATVTISAIDGSAPSVTIAVTQLPTLFNVTPESLTLSHENDNAATVSVETTAEWTVTAISESWLTVTPSTGKGNATLTVKAGATEDRSQRMATVTLKEHTTGREATVTVTQLPPPAVLTTDKQTLSMSHGAGNEYIAVTSNVGWTVRSSASWCTVSPTQGNGDGSITVSVTRNEALTPRTATITITPDDNSLSTVSIAVKQAEYVEIKPGEGDNTTPAYSRTTK